MTPLFITAAIMAHIFVIASIEDNLGKTHEEIRRGFGGAYLFFACLFIAILFWVKLAFVVLT